MKRIFQTMKGEFATIAAGEREFKKFGLAVGGVLLVIAAAVAFMDDSSVHPALLGVGLLLVVLGLFLPRILKLPYLLWMGIAIVLGFFVGNLLLGVLFYVFVTPIALTKKLFDAKAKKVGDSYWITREKSWTNESMEQLF